MPGIYMRDLPVAPGIDSNSLITTSETTTDELYTTTVGDFSDTMIGPLSACNVKRTSPYSIGTGSWVKIPFDTTVYDFNSDFDTTNYWFDVPTNGVYAINGEFSLNNGSITNWPVQTEWFTCISSATSQNTDIAHNKNVLNFLWYFGEQIPLQLPASNYYLTSSQHVTAWIYLDAAMTLADISNSKISVTLIR